MHPIVIGDLETFKKFEEGEVVTVHPVMMQDYLDRIKEAGMLVEVWLHSNAPPHPSHIGKVLNIGGVVPSIPHDGPKAIALTIKLHQHKVSSKIPLS